MNKIEGWLLEHMSVRRWLMASAGIAVLGTGIGYWQGIHAKGKALADVMFNDLRGKVAEMSATNPLMAAMLSEGITKGQSRVNDAIAAEGLSQHEQHLALFRRLKNEFPDADAPTAKEYPDPADLQEALAVYHEVFKR